jgi:hypothetical protein
MKTNKMPLWIALTFVVVLCFSISSCEKENASDVNQDKIYTDYEVFYDNNSDKSWVIARFRFGGATGTILKLDSTSFVSFGNDTLPYNDLFFGHFKEYAGRINNGTFTYRNLKNEVFVNSLPAYDTIAFSPSFTLLTKSVANTITWSGTPLAINQNVGLFVGGWTWGQDALKVQTSVGATNLVLGTNELAQVPVGPAICFMDRSTDVAVSQGTNEGGRIRGKFRAKNQTIQIVQ